MSRKLSFEEIVERQILGKGQEYLLDYLRTATGDIGIYEHSVATKTCAQKIDLLSRETLLPWTLQQAIRAVYFKDGKFLNIFVTPEYGKTIPTVICAGKSLGTAKSEATKEEKEDQKATPVLLPEYMEQGTCTPFIYDWDISPAAGSVQKIFLHRASDLETKLADFSIGGKGPEAQKRSLWMPYGDMVQLMKQTFGELVTVQDMYAAPPKLRYTPGKKVLIPASDKVQA